MEDTGVIATRNVICDGNSCYDAVDEDESNVVRILIIVFFILALIFVCALFITYYVMMQRKK